MLYSVLHVIPPLLLFKEKGIISVVNVFSLHTILDTDIFKPTYFTYMVFLAQRVKLVDRERN